MRNLARLEERIDVGPTPHSGELKGWRIAGRVDIRRTEHEIKNVVGVLEGTGPTADETIVVGASTTTTSAAGKSAIHFILRRPSITAPTTTLRASRS